jgi:hypothetical protein
MSTAYGSASDVATTAHAAMAAASTSLSPRWEREQSAYNRTQNPPPHT